jgi:predicted hydrocarbon binding protein
MKNLKMKSLKYNGHGTYEFFNDRVIMFPPQLIDTLSSIYGEGVKSLLVWLGKKAGWTLVSRWEDKLKPKSLSDLTKQFMGILSQIGLGRFVIIDASEEAIIIEHHSNISLELESKAKYYCYFVQGMMTGFGEFALYKVDVKETQCSIDDPNIKSCKYLITRKSAMSTLASLL